MATNIILPAKRKQDKQRYGFDFGNLLYPGDSITVATVTVRVFSGVDPSPALLLDGAHQLVGATVFQTIKDGIPGVIYELDVTVNTTQGFTHVIEARLAIPPEDPGADENFVPFFLSSKPYPEYFFDQLNVFSIPQSGSLRDLIQDFTSTERLNIFASPLGGILKVPLVTTNNLERLNLTGIPQGGQLRQVLLTTNNQERLNVFGLPQSGVLRDALVSTINEERLNISAVPIGGSLSVP